MPTEDWLPSLNPANQTEVVGYAAQAGIAEAEAALAAARVAQPGWARIPAGERAALFERMAALMRRDKAALCALRFSRRARTGRKPMRTSPRRSTFCNFYATVMRELGRPQRTRRWQANQIFSTGGHAAQV